jgi:hypothetical protein
MKLIYGIQRGILYPATTRFYNDLQARSSNFWGNKRKSRHMSTYVTKRGALIHESGRMSQVASTGDDVRVAEWQNTISGKLRVETLSDMDAEIFAQEGKLSTVREVKARMMSVLLSGKIRLISGK